MKKGVAILSAFLMSAALISPITWAESIEEKKAELDEVQRQMEDNEAQRNANQKRISNAVDRLIEARNELAAAKEELAVVEGQQRILEGQIRANERALAIKQKEFENTKSIYKKRLRDIYENGQVNYLDVLLGATDFRDFASRMYLLQRVIRQDTRLIDKLTKQKSELAAKQASLDKQKVQLDATHEQVLEKQRVVARKKAEQQALYEQALAEKSRLDAEYEELQRNSQEITAMIQRMEAEGRMMASAHGSGQFTWPVYGEITSPFGWRIHPIWGSEIFHAGLDIAADYGQPVVAADSGTVVYAGWMGGYGNAVMIDHGGGIVTLYGHNSSLTVGVGENVSKGQTIALAGSTGNSTGPHCHFEVRVHGEVVQPLNYLP
jgi:murein DD-endopeptidase MepM/ murein hydrolase activator NlpD